LEEIIIFIIILSMSNEVGVLTFNCMAKGYGALRGKMIGDFQVSTVLEANE
jgi:hypothetical protein